MRKQYHFRPSPKGLLAWDVNRLIQLSRTLPERRVLLSDIREVDSPYWFAYGESPTCRNLLEHIRLIEAADLSYPIILSSDGGVMDGMHRVLKALLLGESEIRAFQFDCDPEPDYVGQEPEDLPY